MIELTSEQRRAMAEGEALRIVDPVTQDAYVLVRAEDFERLTGEARRSAFEPPPGIAPMVLRSMQAFWRDLPALLMHRGNHRMWAAYHGDERVAITRSDLDAYQECFRRGLKDGEIYVGNLELDPEGIPPWGTLQSDRSFYEVTDDGAADDA